MGKQISALLGPHPTDFASIPIRCHSALRSHTGSLPQESSPPRFDLPDSSLHSLPGSGWRLLATDKAGPPFLEPLFPTPLPMVVLPSTCPRPALTKAAEILPLSLSHGPR